MDDSAGSVRLGTHRALQAFYILGALLLALALVLLYASNPPWLTHTVKLAFVCAVLIGMNCAGWYLRYEKKRYLLLGEALFLIGGVAFGAGIWLIAQIFHFPLHFSWGFFLWLLGVLPLGIITESGSLTSLCAVLLPAWALTLIECSVPRNTVPPVLAWYFPFFGILLAESYRRRQPLTLALCLLGIFPVLPAWISKPVSHRPSALPHIMFLLYGFLLYLAGIFHTGRWHRNFGALLRIVGLFGVLIAGLILSSNIGYLRGLSALPKGILVGLTVWWVGLCATSLAAVAVRKKEGILVLCALLIFAAWLGIPAVLPGTATADAYIWSHLGSALGGTLGIACLFVQIVFLVSAAYLSGLIPVFHTACLCAAVTMVAWYVVSLRNLLLNSYLVASCGLLLIVFGFLWERQVRRMARTQAAQKEKEDVP